MNIELFFLHEAKVKAIREHGAKEWDRKSPAQKEKAITDHALEAMEELWNLAQERIEKKKNDLR